MLVQHFLPSSTTTSIENSSFSPSSSSTKNSKTNFHSSLFNSESTGFQPATDENYSMGYNDKIKTHLSTWPRKLTSVMEIHRQRFSQLNPRFKQQQEQTTQQRTTTNQPISLFQQSPMCPVILPTASRPQPRQQARSKANHDTMHLLPAQSNRRSNTANLKQQTSTNESHGEYITLANLTKLIHVLQTQEKLNDHDSSTDTSTSSTNSTKQRVQQHLQATATRWWKPTRSPDNHSFAPTPSSFNANNRPNVLSQLLTSDILQQKQRQDLDNLPTIVSKSARYLNIPANSGNATSNNADSESSTDIETTIISPIVQLTKSAHAKHVQQPIIMQAGRTRFRSHDPYQFYNQQTNINVLQQQRLIRQT